jgi:DNA-binding IclR family transcriptional regulator
LESSDLVRAVVPYLQQMAERLDVSAALAVPDGLDMVFVAYRTSARVATLRLGVGSMLPIANSAIGRAYLWGLPAAPQRSLIEQIRQHVGEQGDAVAAGLRASFAELDATGVCCVASAVLRDTFGFALPVRLGRQGICMAMSCGRAALAPDLPAERRRIVPVLRQTADDVQRGLADIDGQP